MVRRTLQNRLRWLIVLRLVVTTTVLVPLALLQLAQPLSFESVDFLYTVGGLAYALSLVWLTVRRLLSARPAAQAWLQLLGDAGLVTMLVYHMGGASNHFSILYLSVIAAAAVLLDRRAAATVAGLSWLLYAAVVIALETGWLGPPQSGLYIQLSAPRLAYDLGIQLLGFLAAAWLMSHRALNVSRVELELEHQQERFADLEALQRDIFESVPSGLVLADLGERVLAVNPAGRRILGARADELLGHTLTALELLPEPAAVMIASGYGEHPRLERTWRHDGRERLLGYDLTSLSRGGGEPIGYVLIFQDLTDLKRLEERLRLQDRMAAVGELAAGVAHEIGNPLTAISGSVQMLSGRAAVAPQDRQLLEIMRKETERLSRTIRSLLEFARPRRRQDVQFAAGELLRESMELLRNSSEVLPEHRLELEVGDPETRLCADRDQVTQVFWNLARNALRAMPAGGTLRVETHADGDAYVLRFVDNGSGMTDEQRANVFHPFRSFFDGGTGMGMAIVYRIVEEHGGRVEVDSSPGRGTTITVALPLVPLPALSAR